MTRQLCVLFAALACVVALTVAPRADMLEDFEQGHMNSWQQAGGSPVGGQVTAAAAHDGNYGAEVFSTRTGWWYNDEVQVGWGDCLSVWTKLNNSSWTRNYFGFGGSVQAGCYSVILADNTVEFLIQYNAGFGYENLAAVSQSYHRDWYRVVMHWEDGGVITAELYDSDGVTLLNTVSAVHGAFNTGGIAMRTFGDTGDPGCWDTFTRDSGPSAAEFTTWGQVKSLFR